MLDEHHAHGSLLEITIYNRLLKLVYNNSVNSYYKNGMIITFTI